MHATGATILRSTMAKPDSQGRCPDGHYLHVDQGGHKFCIKMYKGVQYPGLFTNAAGFLQRVATAIIGDSRPCGACGKKL
jgi:hypothetical protein